ncbi:MAG: Holliday junction resolvase RuvX [Anaerolineae bacterium]|nr:Holliday junction resolvase RuvX [Anaerolineae bacterium]
MPRSLALDVGNRRIGVAVSDESKMIARPLEVIDRKTQNPIKHILAHIANLKPDEIIVGFPYHFDGQRSPQSELVEAFVEQLRPHISIPILYEDERFSTGEAQEVMKSTRKGKAAAKPQPDDAIAAAVILQRYLDSLQ